MSPEEMVHAGKLVEALAVVEQIVRDKPASARHRFFLFQLLSVLGQWNRALTQLNVAAELDGDDSMTATVYRPALQCEAFRQEVFGGKMTPLIFGEPPEWIGPLIAANEKWGQGQVEAAGALRRSALRRAQVIAGIADGKPFKFLMDADARLGPVIEAYIEGKYFWVPLLRVHRISIEPPTDLHDLVWARAEFGWSNGGTAAGLIPVRYATPPVLVKPPNQGAADPLLLLARKTDWSDQGDGLFVGRGHRHWQTDTALLALFETREIVFDNEVQTKTGADVSP